MDLSQARGGAEEIVDKYADMVFRIAFSQTKNRADADDVFQDVFLKLFRSEAVFDSEEHIKAWLIRVAVNTSRKLFASAWNRRTVPLTDELPYEDEPPGGGVLDAVKSLPAKYRAVIHLFYFEELSVAEIASALGRKENTVKSQLSRGRALLKTKLKGELEIV